MRTTIITIFILTTSILAAPPLPLYPCQNLLGHATHGLPYANQSANLAPFSPKYSIAQTQRGNAMSK
jgi:hypothetical protein